MEKEIATLLQYSCLGNPMDSGAWSLKLIGLQELDTTWQLNHHHHHIEHTFIRN